MTLKPWYAGSTTTVTKTRKHRNPWEEHWQRSQNGIDTDPQHWYPFNNIQYRCIIPGSIR